MTSAGNSLNGMAEPENSTTLAEESLKELIMKVDHLLKLVDIPV
jgi:hypothetical protein